MLSRFDTVPECDGQTDGQTDEQNCYIKIARQHLLCHRGASLTVRLCMGVFFVQVVANYPFVVKR